MGVARSRLSSPRQMSCRRSVARRVWYSESTTGSCASAGRTDPRGVDPVFLAERHPVPLKALRVGVVLLAQLLDLRRELGHPVHRAQLRERERQQQRADEHRERDDRETQPNPTSSWKNLRIAWKTLISG